MPRYNYKSGFPDIVGGKLYKTCQTRGAEPDQVYQNRVKRNNTAIIPLSAVNTRINPNQMQFENGYIVIASPSEYFSANPPDAKDEIPDDLQLGENLLVFYRTRDEWEQYNPLSYGWEYAKSRSSPLQGQYVARVPNTTSEETTQIFEGYTDSSSGGVGAGIRVYEYASSRDIVRTQYQLSYLAWRTKGMLDLVRQECNIDPSPHKNHVDRYCNDNGLADTERLETCRFISQDITICPLCRKPILGSDLASRVQQAEGRDIPDLTVTSANLFHLAELRVGEFNHREYNLGWGHYHCNTVVRDYGIKTTLRWMGEVLEANNYRVIPDEET